MHQKNCHIAQYLTVESFETKRFAVLILAGIFLSHRAARNDETCEKVAETTLPEEISEHLKNENSMFNCRLLVDLKFIN